MTEELLEQYPNAIETLTLIPSGNGRFEVVIGDDLIYSKKATGRHAEPGEIAGLFESRIVAKTAAD